MVLVREESEKREREEGEGVEGDGVIFRLKFSRSEEGETGSRVYART